ncbi:unnamed protein product [Prorocentrum cordatum]|uniref:Uncharacterized protein n=1 Tax=Prorocentrum cordatum TaxID=2364126 RepID=A0ABN9Y2L2_9DINO|nr:unnamed protein product [Polarella glacialis]
MPPPPPDSASALAAAACFVLHGANATRIALGHHPVGEVKGWWPVWSFLFLSAQGNLVVLVYGLVWLLEICVPGSTMGLLYLSAHLVCGLALQVFLLYYTFCHFHKEGYDGLKKLEARGELLYNGDTISVDFFVRTQNYMHAPLLPLAGLPLIAIDREELVAGMMGLAGTFVFALNYFCCYAALVLGIKRFSNIHPRCRALRSSKCSSFLARFSFLSSPSCLLLLSLLASSSPTPSPLIPSP